MRSLALLPVPERHHLFCHEAIACMQKRHQRNLWARGVYSFSPCEHLHTVPVNMAGFVTIAESWSAGIEFLVERCWHSTKLAVSLHWSLIVDCDDPATRARVGAMQAQLYATLQEHNPAAHEAVNSQVRFKAFLDQFSKEVRACACLTRAYMSRCSSTCTVLLSNCSGIVPAHMCALMNIQITTFICGMYVRVCVSVQYPSGLARVLAAIRMLPSESRSPCSNLTLHCNRRLHT
jgi:hypothetical protein